MFNIKTVFKTILVTKESLYDAFRAQIKFASRSGKPGAQDIDKKKTHVH
jgi:hypothetical protein